MNKEELRKEKEGVYEVIEEAEQFLREVGE